jgi:branched-chain amino acid transport system permease protein
MNILSFSQGEFMMISMYLAFYLNQSLKLDPLLSIPIVAVVMFFFGVMIYLLLIKKALKGPLLSQRLVTFSLGLVLTNGMLMLAGGQYKNIPNLLVQGSIDLGVLTISKQKLVPLVVCIIVTTLLFWFMKKTTLGNAISATAQDKMAAELIGINTNRAYMIAFGLSASIAGIAGCALTYFYYINPTVGAPFLIFGFIAVCIGGFGSIIGAFLGGLLMGFIDLFTGTYLSVSYKYLAICMLFIIIVSWKPKGLFGR